MNGRRVVASRFSWEMHHGARIPGRMFVCHRCDNPPCVNPDHLFVGTQSDNIKDAHRKGRAAIHNAGLPRHLNASSKLTLREIRWVRKACAARLGTHREIGARFGISAQTVGAVAREAGIQFGKRGRKHVSAKLTEPKVRAIRQRHAAGERGAALAREFRVSDGAIRSVLRRDTWRHVE